ncbi:MAG: CIA30 family protein [Acidobacteriota bacterium]
MARIIRSPSSLALSIALIVFAAAAVGQELPKERFAITDVRVFDGTGIIEQTTVLVNGGTIAAVGSELPIPEGTPVIEGAGKTLLPGLIDCHTHTWGSALTQALTFGVTTSIDMFTQPDYAAGVYAKQAENGNPGEADLYSAGILATAPGGHGTQYGFEIPTLTQPEDADAFVADRLAEGSKFIKIVHEDGSGWGRSIPTLDLPTVEAVVTATHAREHLAVAHIGTLDSAEKIIPTGVDGLVHLFTDRPPSDRLIEAAGEAGIFVIPTLAVLAQNGTPVLEDANLSPFLESDQVQGLKRSFAGATPQEKLKNAFDTIRRLHEASVPILAGTDAPNPGTAHGASMHHELALLVAAGLTPAEALAGATAHAAEAFRLLDRGRIAPGRRADLLLVEGNPLANIAATRDIVGVWKLGVPAARQEVAATETRLPPLAATTISTFDTGDGDEIPSAFGFGWQPTTDEMAGGASQVNLVLVEAGDGKALQVTGEILTGFAFPWAGAMFFPADQPMQPANLSHRAGIRFRTQGDGGTYRLMVFAQSRGAMPAQATFEAGDGWQTEEHTFESFGVDGSDLVGIAFTGGPGLGTFRFEIDDVTFY